MRERIHFRLESVIHHISLNFRQLLKVKKISGSVIANGMNLGFSMKCMGMRIGAGPSHTLDFTETPTGFPIPP